MKKELVSPLLFLFCSFLLISCGGEDALVDLNPLSGENSEIQSEVNKTLEQKEEEKQKSDILFSLLQEVEGEYVGNLVMGENSISEAGSTKSLTLKLLATQLVQKQPLGSVVEIVPTLSGTIYFGDDDLKPMAFVSSDYYPETKQLIIYHQVPNGLVIQLRAKLHENEDGYLLKGIMLSSALGHVGDFTIYRRRIYSKGKEGK